MMLISYNADLLPKVRMLGQIRYNEPWLHFSRCINEWVLYVIRDGNLYLQEDGVRYHLSAEISSCWSRAFRMRAIRRPSATIITRILRTRTCTGPQTTGRRWRCWRKTAAKSGWL